MAKQSNDTPCVKILELHEDYSFGKIFRVLRAKLQHRRFDGTLSAPVTRISFERGDSVGILLYDRREDSVVMVRQFRYPVYAGLSAVERRGESARSAWLLEIVAGVKDSSGKAEDVAHKELFEEAGYRIKGGLQALPSFYPSPGGSSERIMLFFAEVEHDSRVGRGGGVEEEGEDIQVVTVPFADAIRMIETGAICDAKTIIALQSFALSERR